MLLHEQIAAEGSVVAGLRFRQDAPADRDHRVCRQHIAAFALGVALHGGKGLLGLLAAQALGERARMLGTLRRLVDIGGQDAVGLDASLLQELDPAGRSRGKHELVHGAHRIWPATTIYLKR